MSAARWIKSQGVKVQAVGDSLSLAGLSSLTPEQAEQVVTYAHQHKDQILAELTPTTSNLVENEPPLLAGQIHCRGCDKPFTPKNPLMLYCQARCFNTVYTDGRTPPGA